MSELRPTKPLEGVRFILPYGGEDYPEQLMNIPDPPKKLYGIGNPQVLTCGLSVIGARKATPYGRDVAFKFAKIASEHGVTIISGGALGCDSAAHRGCLEGGSPTVVVLGGGCDCIYPESNRDLFQEVVDKAVPSSPNTNGSFRLCPTPSVRAIASLRVFRAQRSS